MLIFLSRTGHLVKKILLKINIIENEIITKEIKSIVKAESQCNRLDKNDQVRYNFRDDPDSVCGGRTLRRRTLRRNFTYMHASVAP